MKYQAVYFFVKEDARIVGYNSENPLMAIQNAKSMGSLYSLTLQSVREEREGKYKVIYGKEPESGIIADMYEADEAFSWKRESKKTINLSARLLDEINALTYVRDQTNKISDDCETFDTASALSELSNTVSAVIRRYKELYRSLNPE